MSGHSKWNNIQGRKNAQDAKRGKIFRDYREKSTWRQRVAVLIPMLIRNFD